MPKLWLTYAWKDNADQDVDHVINELQRVGLEVSYDRAELLAGQSLWQQIDAAMNDPSVDAWAMLVTENSLRSQPCQEEIAYALDRALRGGRHEFPLIGIFPRPVDRSLIPSAIATRLYVNLTASDWQRQVLDGVTKSKTTVLGVPPVPVGIEVHKFADAVVVEVWPRSGRWFPFVAAVPINEANKLQAVMQGPRGGITGAGMTASAGKQQNEMAAYEIINHAIDANTTAHVFLEELTSWLEIGQPDGGTYTLRLKS